MTSSYSIMIGEFAKSTQNVCMCLAIAIFLIITFMMTPLNTFLISSMFGKVVVIILLGYTFYYNVRQTNKFHNNFKISLTSGEWNAIKTNVVCSYIFSAFLLVLLVSVLKFTFKM
jgi:hypothetical protein